VPRLRGMQSEEQVGENLKACFGPAIAAPTNIHFADWCRLGSFLSDPTEMFQAMHALDLAMYDRLCKNRLATKVEGVEGRKMVTSAYHDYCFNNKPGQPKPSVAMPNKDTLDKSVVSRLLSEVLSTFEAENGFEFETGDYQATGKVDIPDRTTPVNAKVHVSTYHGFVQAQDFNLQLTKRSHWKDPGAEQRHGEFTHRLQWYAVTSRLFMDAGHAATVFESIGKCKAAFARPGPNAGFLYLWDALCDRTNQKDVSFTDELFKTEGAPGRSQDFRSPENLNCFLKDNEGFGEWRWPLLRDFLKARYKKRKFEVSEAVKAALADPRWVNDAGQAVQFQYLCRKLYNVSFWSLPVDDARVKKVLQIASAPSDQILKF
jgi:hypothetical protein